MTHSDRFSKTIADFDEINSTDPNRELVNGVEVPKELVYAKRMTECLAEFAPDASELVQLAGRCQHIKRWEVPRGDFPEGRAGYLKWRTSLYKFHGEQAAAVLAQNGYDQDMQDRLKELFLKKSIKTNPESQLLEDVVCLVFLKYYFDDFIAKHPEDKLISIVQKTWGKMSEKAHQAALAMPHSEGALAIVQKALS